MRVDVCSRPFGLRGTPLADVYSMCATASFVRFCFASSVVVSMSSSTPGQLVDSSSHVEFAASHSADLSMNLIYGWLADHAVNARESAARR